MSLNQYEWCPDKKRKVLRGVKYIGKIPSGDRDKDRDDGAMG
jgi:hypothetical protein